MFYFKEKKSIKRTLRYFFSVSLIIWALISIYISYQYIRSSSKEVIAKWWTFVEWIFNTTSYLPYLKNDWQSLFYQWLLFNSCLDYDISKDWNIEFTDKLCSVKTNDYKTYYISLSWEYKRSDWVPLNLEDIFFTYSEIIKKNIWNIKQLNTYKDIIVLNETDQIKLIFPQSSLDNTLFFANYILPKHALIDDSIENYQQNFSIEPVFSNCWKIMPQTSDPYSLIFDLWSCNDTKLWFYQVKNLESFEKFSNNISQWKSSIVDSYVYPQQIDVYITKNLLSTKLMTIFFNTKSEKSRVRLRRALWWLIINNFFNWDYMNHIKKDNWELFNYFLSKWDNIKSFINRISLWSAITKEDLLDIWIKSLPEKIPLKWTNNRLTFYIENLSWNINLNINIDKAYDKISMNYNTWKEISPEKYSAKEKLIEIILNKDKLSNWLNKFNFYWTTKWKKQTILSLDIYNLTKNEILSWNTWLEPKLTVIYFKEPNSIFVVNRLKEIFKKFDIIENFVFEWFDDANQLEWKLTVWNYDIVISNIDLWLKNDIIKLLSIEKPNINPSQYTNSKIVWLLKDYFKWNTENTVWQINEIYAQDMPFLILWNTFTKLQLKPNISKQLFSTWYDSIYEYNRRKRIYKNLNLTSNVKIDSKKLRNISNFKNFIWENLNK